MGFHRPKLSVRNPWFSGGAEVTTYQLDELLGTKLRALYQRRKGRDLFDLWLCLSRKLIDPDQAVRCFLKYMEHEGHRASRAQFEQNLDEKERDPEFMGDIAPLLNAVITYDPAEAIGLVRKKLIERQGRRISAAPCRVTARKRTFAKKDADDRLDETGFAVAPSTWP